MENNETKERTPQEHLESLAWLKRYVVSKQKYGLAHKIKQVEDEVNKLVIYEWSADVLKRITDNPLPKTL